MMLNELVDTLEHLGFYRYASLEEAEAARAESLQTGFLDCIAVGRGFMTDSEDLAECGVAQFVEEVRPFLERQGVRFEQITEDFVVNGGYSVEVDGRPSLMYTTEEREATLHLLDRFKRRGPGAMILPNQQTG